MIDESVRSDFALLEKHFGGPVGTIGISAQDRAWLVAPLDGGPLRYHVYQRSQQTVQPLFSAYRALDRFPLARRFARVATTRDGLRLPCHLYLPPGTDANGDGLPDAPLPTLLYVHGGPDAAYPWDSWATNRCLQLLANRGYAALRVEFRGAGGFGKSFMEQGWREWGGKSQQDLVDVAHWAVDQRIAQPEKIGIWGWSFGGFSTFATLAFYPDEFACGVAMYGAVGPGAVCPPHELVVARHSAARGRSPDSRRARAVAPPVAAALRRTRDEPAAGDARR